MAERTKDQQIKLVCFDLAKHSFTLYDVDAAGQPVRGESSQASGRNWGGEGETLARSALGRDLSLDVSGRRVGKGQEAALRRSGSARQVSASR